MEDAEDQHKASLNVYHSTDLVHFSSGESLNVKTKTGMKWSLEKIGV